MNVLSQEKIAPARRKNIRKDHPAAHGVNDAQALDIHPGSAVFYNNRAFELLNLNQFEKAVLSYDQAIALNHDYAEAYCNRGIALQHLNRFDSALASYDKALNLKFDNAELYFNRGNALQELKQFEEAVSSYNQAIALRPDHAESYFYRGNAFKELGQFEEVVANYNQTIALNPDYAEAYSNRGNALQELKEFEAAVLDYEMAVALRPDFAEAFFNRGNALQKLNQLEDSVLSYDKAVALKPDYAEVYFNRGLSLHKLQQLDLSGQSFKRAIALKPDFPEAHYNYACILEELQFMEAAVDSYDRAITLKPDYADAYCNRGHAFQKMNRYDLAISSYHKAITLNQNLAEAYWNKSLALLSIGDFTDGWELYEWRWKLENFTSPKRVFPWPLWLGNESLKGKTILLHSEQGLGDSIQFSRYTNLVADLGARVILEVEEPLASLFEELPGVSTFVVKGSPIPACDYHCPLMSLPLAFKTEVSSVPYSEQYLRSKKSKVQYWKKRLGKKRQPRVGLVWSGSVALKNDKNRTILLADLLSHLPVGLDYVSLQKEVREIDRAALDSHTPTITHFGEELKDFTDTAALCELMDVVISVDTSVAHLSGALGRPTWVLLPYCPDWRWMLDRDDSPWYQSVKLYRQSESGEWSSVFGHVNTELLQLFAIGSGNLRVEESQAILHQSPVLGHKPEYAESCFNRGNIFLQLNKLEAAVACYDEAIAHKPDSVEAYSNRGIVLKQLRDYKGAVLSFDTAIAHRPDYAEAYSNRGNALKELKRFDEAVASYDKAIALKPDYTESYINRGHVFKELKQFDLAVESYEQAITLKPDCAESYFYLGNALQELKQFGLAIERYDKATALRPDYAEAYCNRGNALLKLNKVVPALVSYDKAKALKPDYADTYNNRANALLKLNKFESAIAGYEKGIALKPDYAEAYSNLGIALQQLNMLDSARSSYDKAITLNPDFADGYWNKSLTLLSTGDFTDGWKLYEWRWKLEAFTSPKRGFTQPLWLGKESLQGKTILLHSEQGLGDSIQFSRYANLVAELGANVILEVEEPLVGLLNGLDGISDVVVKGCPLPAFDYHCPLLSLPLAFKTEVNSVPYAEQYLRTDKSKVRYWKNRLGKKTKPRVGLVWSGSAVHKNDKNRSILLADLLLYLPAGFHYVSLQKEVREVDRAALDSHTPKITHFGVELQDFTDTVALCELMDVVISVDTSVAHLSGALGRLTWVLLPKCPDWRWMLDRDDSPWYKSVKLYRQSVSGKWGSVFGQIKRDLAFLMPIHLDNGIAAKLNAIFQEALILHQQGDINEAQALYDEILTSDPLHFDSLHLSGIIASQTNNHLKAVELFGKSIAIYPHNPAFHINLGLALHELKRFAEAVSSYDRAIALKPDNCESYFYRGNAFQKLKQCETAVLSYEEAIALKPDYAEAFGNCGNALQELKLFEAAVVMYDQAIELKPDYAEFYLNRGNALQMLKQFEEAVSSYDRAIALKSNYAAAWCYRGNALQGLKMFDAAIVSYDQAITFNSDYADALCFRGNALQELMQFETAVLSYDQAIALQPDLAKAYYNRGNAYQELMQFNTAMESYNQAITLRADFPEAYSNRGNVLKELKRFEAAVSSYEKAIALMPEFPEAFNNLGIAFQDFNQLDSAVAHFDNAISLKPDLAVSYWNKSLALLLGGDFIHGWELYEWRWKLENFPSPKRVFPQPLWLGRESLKGKAILLHTEQGLGDSIQFCRYANLVAELGARVIIEVEEPLVTMFEELQGVSELIVKGHPLPAFDYHCPLMSLPLAFKTDVATVPCSEKYLSSKKTKVQYWEKRLGNKTQSRVGLVWSGSRVQKNDKNRTILLADLIRQLPDGFHYVSLQKEVRQVDRAALDSHTPTITHFGEELNDFSDTAALCELMDVVISVDTSVAHLSGALGRSTWILLPFCPDWRWMLDRDDSPWYQSIKLYRQSKIGEWCTVFERVKADLLQLKK